MDIAPGYREHKFTENRKQVNLDELKSESDFSNWGLVDDNGVAVEHKALLELGVKIDTIPSGRLLRGVPLERTLGKSIKMPSDNAFNYVLAGVNRTLVSPVNGGKGRDVLSFNFYVAPSRFYCVPAEFIETKDEEWKYDWKKLDLEGFKAKPLNDTEFKEVHRNTVIPTHDAVITYNDGIVLVERIGKPLQGFTWLPGGRMQRGVRTEKSLADKVKKETGLDIGNFEFAGVERAFMPEDPFGQGHGTDTVGLIYFARGEGKLITDVDRNHNAPLLIKPDRYAVIRDSLHPFVQKYTDEAISRIASGK